MLNFEDTEEDPTSTDSMTDAANFDGDIERIPLYQPNGDRLRVTMDSNQRANLGLGERMSYCRKTCQPDQLKLVLKSTLMADDVVEEAPQV